MTNHNLNPSDETEKKLLREDVFLGLARAIQNLGYYGEYARNNVLAFGNVTVEDNVLAVKEGVSLALRPTHQDSGEVGVVNNVDDDDPETFISRMRVWTPYEGASMSNVTINGRAERIISVWHDKVEYIRYSDYNLITTASQRVYQQHAEDIYLGDSSFSEVDDREGILYIEEINSHIENLAKTYPEIAERTKRIF